MSLTTDPQDPRLGHGADTELGKQNDAYLILSEEERAKGFVRPVRRSYIHVGLAPRYPLFDLTEEQKGRWGEEYAKWMPYPESESPKTGRFWTQAQLDNRGCGTVTTMAQELAETWARDVHFYGATWCMGCHKHLPVAEFIWEDGSVVGS